MTFRFVLLFCLTLFPLIAEEKETEEPEILTVEQLFNVKTTAVKKEQVLVKKSFYGRAALDESRVVDIAPRFDGFVTVLYADKTYTPITKGQKLLDLYSPELLTAQIELINALNFKLGSKGKSLAKSAEEKLRQYDLDSGIIKRIKTQKKSLDTIPLYAPTSGVLLQKKINKGSAFKKGTNILQIADLSRLWIEADVYQDDREFIIPGQQVKVRVRGVAKPFSGAVESLYPMIDEKSQTFRARIVLQNPDTILYPGMFARVDVIKESREMLTLPKTAVIIKGDKRIVFVAGEWEGEYEPSLIEAKRLPDGKFEILSGLEEGATVVNNALFMMDSDAQINGLY